MRLLQVREAARELGVHENTLRRWEEAGIVRAIHLPSGVRRFRLQDVESLQRQMYDDQAAAAKRQIPVSRTEVTTRKRGPVQPMPRLQERDPQRLP